MTLSRGLDVSHHQGAVNWPALKHAHGLTWGACKATEGASFVDAQFARNWAALKAAGLVRVAYHFARPGTDATTQARRFLAVVKPVAGDVLCLDLEQSDGQGQAAVNAWAREFATVLRQQAPHNTTVAYLGGYASNGTGARLSDHFDYWWYPRYATMNPVSAWPASFAPRLSGNTTGWAAPHIWQWAASLRGAPGLLVDANVSPLTARQLRDGPRSTPTPIPISPEADVPMTDAEMNKVADLVVSKLLRAPIKNSHDGKTAPFAAYVVYGNEAARFARANASAATAAAKDSAVQARAAATAAQAAAAETKALIDGVVTVDVKINGSVQP